MPRSFHFLKKTTWVSLLVMLGIPFVVSFKQDPVSEFPPEYCRKLVLENTKLIITSLGTSLSYLHNTSLEKINIDSLKSQYRHARREYKEIEFFIEYYSTFDCKYFINRPLVPKNEIEFGPKVYEPQGFQVIEEQLFSRNKFDREKLLEQYDLLLQKFKSFNEYYLTVTIEQANIDEALQLEVIRIMCLTLNGYDCTINKECLTECAHSLNGISKVLLSFENLQQTKKLKNVQASLAKCKKKLLKDTDSDKFDRLDFIANHLNPLYEELSSFFSELGISASQVNYGVHLRRVSKFGISSINKQHFSVYRNDTLRKKEQSELGKLLFFDPILSGNNRRACASCHKPNLAFSDGLDKSISYDGQTKVSRNAPSLINVSYQKLFFYDGRAFNLEQQADNVFHNSFEMQMTKEDILAKLKLSDEYKTLFRKAFANTQDSSITFYAVLKSISEFVKTLESKNSKLDKYLAGNHKAMKKEEIRGFNLFNGKALCGSCHFFPLFNGTVPPIYNDSEFEVIGTPADSGNKYLDADIGRKKITNQDIHQFAFKTPTLRNIAFTAPYMHNGVYTNLDQVLDFYNKGGGVGLKFKVDNQTLPFDSLGLSKNELNDIKSFLLSLTDTLHLTSVPKKLPVINNPKLNSRKIGGEY